MTRRAFDLPMRLEIPIDRTIDITDNFLVPSEENGVEMIWRRDSRGPPGCLKVRHSCNLMEKK